MKSNKPVSREKDHESTIARSMILQIAFCLVCGALLIAFDQLALRITAYVLSGVMIVMSAWLIISYIRSTPLQRIAEAQLATGLILLVAGILLAFSPNFLNDSLPSIWGLALLFGGFLKIQYAFDEMSVGITRWWIMLILAAFSLVIGVLSLLNPAFLGESRNLVIGILLVAEAVLDITVWFLLRHALKKHPSGATIPIHESVPEAPAPVPAPAPAPAPAPSSPDPDGETQPEPEA